MYKTRNKTSKILYFFKKVIWLAFKLSSLKKASDKLKNFFKKTISLKLPGWANFALKVCSSFVWCKINTQLLCEQNVCWYCIKYKSWKIFANLAYVSAYVSRFMYLLLLAWTTVGETEGHVMLWLLHCEVIKGWGGNGVSLTYAWVEPSSRIPELPASTGKGHNAENAPLSQHWTDTVPNFWELS